MLIKADVIEVDAIKEVYATAIAIACDTCAIEYSLEDYQILKDNKKLIYFLYTLKEDDSLILCHDCFFKNIKKISKGEEEVKLEVTAKEEVITMLFTPQEMLPEDYDEDDDGEDYLGLF